MESSILDIISLYDVRFSNFFEDKMKLLFEEFNFNELQQEEILKAYMEVKADENCHSKILFLDYYFERNIQKFSLSSLKKCKKEFKDYIPMFINDFIYDSVINFFDNDDYEDFDLESYMREPIHEVESSLCYFDRAVAELLSMEEVSADDCLEDLPEEFEEVNVPTCIGTMFIPKSSSILHPKNNEEKLFNKGFDDHCIHLKKKNLERFKKNCGGSKKKALQLYQQMQFEIPESQFAVIFDFDEITEYIDSLSVSRRFMSMFRKK